MQSNSELDVSQCRPVEQMGFDVEAVLRQLRLHEKIALLSGTDFWHTKSLPRLGIPAVRLSDGPNGVRGTKFFNGTPAASFPCGTALGATWDVDLVRGGGVLQAQEAIAKGVSAILGPTVNIQRSPLGGRGFESYSEDPVLSGTLGAAAISGIQSSGVAATLKHFICNDQEDHRQAYDVTVSDRALHEIYAMPFQIAQRDAQPICIMTAYNKVNGCHCSESRQLLQNLLRNELRFQGLVMSDWFGTYSISTAIKAGLDLEMPGPAQFRGLLVNNALSSGKLSNHELDDCVRRILTFVSRVSSSLGIPENAEERTIDTPATTAILRKMASESIVLLKNDDSLLPFSPSRTMAVIGPNASKASYSGGGSASLRPYRAISPLTGFLSQSDLVSYTLGAPGWKHLPLLTEMTTTKDGKQGLTMTVYSEPPTNTARKPIESIHVDQSDIFLMDYKHPLIEGNLFYATFVGVLTPDVSGVYEFSLSVAGTAKLFVDGKCIIDNETKQTGGSSFFSSGTAEEYGHVSLTGGQTYEVQVTFGSDPTVIFERPVTNGFGGGGIRIGLNRQLDLREELERAKILARSVDQVVICAGLNGDWESEGYDRKNMNLPPGVDELIQIVASANPNTAVVIQSGTPVAMPWIRQVKAVVQAWYGGNECGNGIADVIFGVVNPGGKLPLTFPERVEDNPAFCNTQVDANRILYGEDIFVGYRHYEFTDKPVLFPFGHGLSYTAIEIDFASTQVEQAMDDILVSTTLRNLGPRDGSQVVQVYVQQKTPSVRRPVKELKGFSKSHVKVGCSEQAFVRIRKKYATSWWDERQKAWIQEAGDYNVLLGDSSANVSLIGSFTIDQTSWWNGL